MSIHDFGGGKDLVILEGDAVDAWGPMQRANPGTSAPGKKQKKRGQRKDDALRNRAAPGGDHKPNDDHLSFVPANSQDRGHGCSEIQSGFAPLLAELREHHRLRVDFHKEEKALTLRAKAICRRFVGGDKTIGTALYKAAIGKGEHELAVHAMAAIEPLLTARTVVEGARKLREKHMRRLAKQLPCADWWCAHRGMAIDGFAAVMAECGDLSNYSNPAKVWKRMGLAVMPDGRQRLVAGNPQRAIEHGYSPERRAIVWNIGDCIIKANGDYRPLYDERKALELTRVETKGHAHNRAKRYMEKRVLRDLWRAWRQAKARLPSGMTMPVAVFLETAA